MVLKCANCRYEKLEADVGPCFQCFGFCHWKPKKSEVKEQS